MEVADRPGVLHAVTGVFARHDVSIRAAEQEGLGPDARLVFITHDGPRGVDAGHGARAAQPRRGAQVGSLLRVIGGVTGALRLHPRRVRRSSASPTRCSPGSPPTAGCTCRRSGRRCRPASRAPATPQRAARDRPAVRRRRVCRRTRVRRLCDEAYATFAHPAVVPLVQLRRRALRRGAVPRADAGVQGRRAAAGRPHVRRGAPRPWAAGHHRRRHQWRHRLGGDRRREGVRQRRHRHPVSRTVAPATCSAGR